MLSIALWKSPGSLHWRGFSSSGPVKILTGDFLGGSLASDNLWDLDWPGSGFSGGLDSRPVEGRARPRSGLKPAPTGGFWGRSGGTDEGGSGSLEDSSVSMERLRMRSMYFRDQ